MPSIVAEIGSVVEEHLKSIGMIVDPEMDAGQRALIADKRAAYEAKTSKKKPDVGDAAADPSSRRKPGPIEDAAPAASEEPAGQFPPGATLCFKCNNKAMVLMDGCQTCLNCGYSKCG
jgi:hypothetical protein